MTELNFLNKTIGELKQITEDYERLQIENTRLKIKYPNKIKKSTSAEDLIEDLKWVFKVNL